jgi:Zn finger protein HypA/HybF involved in hydrogenase expression
MELIWPCLIAPAIGIGFLIIMKIINVGSRIYDETPMGKAQDEAKRNQWAVAEAQRASEEQAFLNSACPKCHGASAFVKEQNINGYPVPPFFRCRHCGFETKTRDYNLSRILEYCPECKHMSYLIEDERGTLSRTERNSKGAWTEFDDLKEKWQQCKRCNFTTYAVDVSSEYNDTSNYVTVFSDRVTNREKDCDAKFLRMRDAAGHHINLPADINKLDDREKIFLRMK